jgi:hypothetical protein
MLDEKKNEAVELTDDELEQVFGGYTENYFVSATDTCGRFQGNGEAICQNCNYKKRVVVQNRTRYRCSLGRV